MFTGIGESETAYRLGQALFETFDGTQHPCGLLTIMGGDFSENSIYARDGGLAEVLKAHILLSTSYLIYLIRYKANC